MNDGHNEFAPPHDRRPGGGGRECRAAEQNCISLSATQRRMLSRYQSTDGGADHNISIAFQVKGHLDRPALEGAFARVLNRHEVLRTNFLISDSGSMQAIVHDRCASIEFQDLTHLSECSAELTATTLAQETVACRFKLDRDLLVRTLLLRTGPTSYLLLLVIHHIVFDGWSSEVFAREISAVYNSLVDGSTADLPPLQMQFGDFARTEEVLDPEIGGIDLAYWRGQLAGLSPLELPTDYPRPAQLSGRGAIVSFRLPNSDVAKIREFAGKLQTSVFVCFMTGFQIALSRYSGEFDIAIGTPIAYRDKPELEGLIGPLIDTVPIRQSLADDPSFAELAHRTKEAILGALGHRSTSFNRLMEELRKEPEIGEIYRSRVLFEFEYELGPSWPMNGLELTPIEIARKTELFDLDMVLGELRGEIYGVIGYSADLFAPDTVRRISHDFIALLKIAVAEPDRKISSLPAWIMPGH